MSSAKGRQARIAQNSKKIEAAADEILEALTGVEDKTPAWLQALRTWGFVVAIVAVIGALWYIGALPIIRRILWNFGKLIPKPDRQRAELDAQMIRAEEQGEVEKLQQLKEDRLALERQQLKKDPAYKAALKRELSPSRARQIEEQWRNQE